jgi:hypothetical protein
MSLRCLVFGHDVRVRFFFNTRIKIVGHQRKGMCAIAVCNHCGKELSPPANQPRHSS